MSFLAKVAALKASGFRETLGLPAKEQLAAPAAFELALQGVRGRGRCSRRSREVVSVTGI